MQRNAYLNKRIEGERTTTGAWFLFCVAAVFCFLTAGQSRAAEVVLLYTGDTQSFLDVCGCADDQLGGIARRATMVRDLRRSHPDALLLDAGGLFAGDTVLDQLRCKIHLNAMKAMRYDVANAAVGELRFGQAFFETMRDSIGVPFASANLKVDGARMGAETRILNAGDVRVGIVGVAGEREIEAHGMAMGTSRLHLPEGVEVALDGVESAVAKASRAADLVVVLSDLDRESERDLIRQNADIDVVISTRSNETTQRIGNALVLGTQPQGKAIGQAILTVENGRVTAERVTPIPLSEAIAEDRAIKQLVDGFYNQVTQSAALQQTARPRFAGFALEDQLALGNNRYVGAEACAGCHAAEAEDWEHSHHAGAFNRLLQQQKHYQPDCVTCHTTGFGYPTGFQIGKDALTHVQCEVCHGPGERHTRRPEARNIRRTPPAELCQRCHDADQTPDFDARFPQMLAEVNHAGHGSPHVESHAPAEREELGQGGRPRVELFVMADCPYGIRAEQNLGPMFHALRDQIDFQLYFIAEEAEDGEADAAPAPVRQRPSGPGCQATTATGTGRFRSLHGDVEVAEGIRQTVAMSLYPDRFWDYISCRNQAGIATEWRGCATQVGMDADKIAASAESATGEDLFAENIRRANVLGVQASPTLRVNGRLVDAAFDAAAVAQVLCRNRDALPFCADVPACRADVDCAQPGKVGLCRAGGMPNAHCEFLDPVSFRATILNDATCDVCDTYPLVRSTLSLFPGAAFQTVDVNSWAGQNLISRYGLDRVPSAVMMEGFEKTARFGQYAHIMRRVGEQFVPSVRLNPVTRLLRGRDLQGMDLFLDVESRASLDIAARLLDWVKKVDAPARLRLHFVGDGEQNALFRQAAPNRVGDALLCHYQKRASATDCIDQAGIVVQRRGDRATVLALARELGVAAIAPAVVIDGRFVVQAKGLEQVEAVFYSLHPESVQRDRNLLSDTNN